MDHLQEIREIDDINRSNYNPPIPSIWADKITNTYSNYKSNRDNKNRLSVDQALSALIDWKKFISMVCEYLDWRQLILLGLVCKDFLNIIKFEITRREQIITNGEDFYSFRNEWFLARRCSGRIMPLNAYSYLNSSERLIECSRMEEILILGSNITCRACNRLFRINCEINHGRDYENRRRSKREYRIRNGTKLLAKNE